MHKKAFTILELIIVTAVIAGLGIAVFFLLRKDTPSQTSTVEESSPTPVAAQESDTEPPVLAKNIGFKFEAYDLVTKSAGDLVFSDIPALKDKNMGNSLWHDYGIPSIRDGSSKKNVQTTFILPAGTKITSMIDGEVVGITELYSKDVGIMIAKDQKSKWRYEHEHVINPKVKIGDKVKAGDVIAEVGPHTNSWEYGKNGLFEIGLYRANPNGVGGSEDCVFKFLDPSVKDAIHVNVSSFYTAWEAFRKDTSIFDQEKYYSPGCAIGETISWETVGQ